MRSNPPVSVGTSTIKGLSSVSYTNPFRQYSTVKASPSEVSTNFLIWLKLLIFSELRDKIKSPFSKPAEIAEDFGKTWVILGGFWIISFNSRTLPLGITIFSPLATATLIVSSFSNEPSSFIDNVKVPVC